MAGLTHIEDGKAAVYKREGTYYAPAFGWTGSTSTAR